MEDIETSKNSDALNDPPSPRSTSGPEISNDLQKRPIILCDMDYFYHIFGPSPFSSILQPWHLFSHNVTLNYPTKNQLQNFNYHKYVTQLILTLR